VTKKKKSQKTRRGISWPVVVAMLVLIVGVLAWRGYDYYLLSLDDRVEHPDYRALRSSGDVGYGYGVAGTFLIFTNLLYLARRRLAKWKMGSVKTWLDVHVFTGLSGALFISFHSTFKARSTMAQVTTLSLLLVVITGLIGRFL
jgi:dihydropyrimidine dehydrogenase (NAD+) subunit PreT